jgi:hypothetical protein
VKGCDDFGLVRRESWSFGTIHARQLLWQQSQVQWPDLQRLLS